MLPAVPAGPAAGSWFNLIMTGTQVVVIIIILAAGFTRSSPKNLTPFLPYGTGGIFSGASFVFFSFIGGWKLRADLHTWTQSASTFTFAAIKRAVLLNVAASRSS